MKPKKLSKKEIKSEQTEHYLRNALETVSTFGLRLGVATDFFFDDYRKYLTEVYDARLVKNSSYSMRAFARDLGVGVSTLSEVLQGKYGLSKKRVALIAKGLKLSTEHAEHFADLVCLKFSKKSNERDVAYIRVQARLSYGRKTISLDVFEVISDWHHLALLELMSLKEFNPDLKWMAKRLGLSEKLVSETLDRLERLALIQKTKHGYQASEDWSAIGNETSSQAIRVFHKQILQKAMDSLESQNVDKREISSTVFAINKENLPQAKKKLLRFRREFAESLAKSEDKNDVYCLGIQFFSLLD